MKAATPTPAALLARPLRLISAEIEKDRKKELASDGKCPTSGPRKLRKAMARDTPQISRIALHAPPLSCVERFTLPSAVKLFLWLAIVSQPVRAHMNKCANL
jgi:hypothetical protein